MTRPQKRVTRPARSLVFDAHLAEEHAGDQLLEAGEGEAGLARADVAAGGNLDLRELFGALLADDQGARGAVDADDGAADGALLRGLRLGEGVGRAGHENRDDAEAEDCLMKSLHDTPLLVCADALGPPAAAAVWS